jgi:hypothetical protein
LDSYIKYEGSELLPIINKAFFPWDKDINQIRYNKRPLWGASKGGKEGKPRKSMQFTGHIGEIEGGSEAIQHPN